MQTIFAVILILGIVLFEHRINTQTLKNAKDLHSQVFSGYNKEVVPNNNFSAPLVVDIVFYLFAVNEFKEKEETLIISAALGQRWTDPSLVWNPASYGNLKRLQVDSKYVWVPWIYLVNNADNMAPVGSDSDFNVDIHSNGLVRYIPGGILNAKCRTDVSKFPFDTQRCNLTLVFWTSDSTIFNFSSQRGDVNMNHYTINNDWNITHNSAVVCSEGNSSKYEVSFILTRRSIYFAWMVIVPTALLCLLNPLVFLLPTESGERISFSMTILLSYAVFLTLVSSSVPATSNPMCLLLSLMICIMVISGFIVVAVIISGIFYHSEANAQGKAVDFVVEMCVTCKKNKDEPIVVRTGKEKANVLDKMFMVTAYILIVLCKMWYLFHIYEE